MIKYLARKQKIFKYFEIILQHIIDSTSFYPMYDAGVLCLLMVALVVRDNHLSIVIRLVFSHIKATIQSKAKQQDVKKVDVLDVFLTAETYPSGPESP